MQNQAWQKLPEVFLKRLAAITPPDKLDAVLQSFCQKKPTTFRTNTLKIDSLSLKKQLTDLAINIQPVDWYPDAFTLVDQPQLLLQDTKLYQDGCLYIQSLSSMIPAIVLDPQPEEKILDLTAAPGSKTTQMAMMMKNTGEIIANDISKTRLYRLKANLMQQGVTNTSLKGQAGERLWQQYPEYFDKTLVDAPCSMEGRFFAEDEKSFKDWTPKKVKMLATKQGYLLRAAISATKVGGTIIYSTCTLSPQENEGVIDWILEKEAGNLIVEEIGQSLPNSLPGIKRFTENERLVEYNQEVSKALRILPSETMEGFFICKLRKIKSNL